MPSHRHTQGPFVPLCLVALKWAQLYLHSQQVLNGNAHQVELHVRLSRDLLDMAEAINVGQDLKRGKQGRQGAEAKVVGGPRW